MNTEKLSNENETEALNKHVVMQALPLAFVKWYSGMEVKTILKAYERWKKESGIVSVDSGAVGKGESVDDLPMQCVNGFEKPSFCGLRNEHRCSKCEHW